MEKSKTKTIAYIFLHTVVLQVIVLLSLGLVGVLAYVGFDRYNSFTLILLGIIAFIAMMFVFLSVSVFAKSYGVSFFARTRREFDGSAYRGATVTRYDYVQGERNLVTGNRALYVQERKQTQGGILYAMGFYALIVGATGILKFVVEALRVCVSKRRQDVWEESRSYMKEKMAEDESKLGFFGFPILSCAALLLAFVLSLPVMGICAHRYHPDRIDFEIYEKENVSSKNGSMQITLSAGMTNTGSAKVGSVEGKIYFYDREGTELYIVKTTIYNPEQYVYLEKGETWEFELYLRDSAEALGALWDLPLDDIEIVMDVIEIDYKGDKLLEFSDQRVVLKPLS